MEKRRSPPPLGNRERQIVDAVYRLGEASVAEVRAAIPDAAGYSSVRKMLSLLEEKGLLKHRQEGTRYIYRPVQSRESASRKAVKHLLATFFAGSPTDAVNTILDVSSHKLADEDFERLRSLIEQARQEGR